MLSQQSAAQATDFTSTGLEQARAWQRLRLHLAPEQIRSLLERVGAYAKTGAKGAAGAYALARLLQYLRPLRPATHPGTAAWRQVCDNPVVPPHEFEARFIGGPDLAAEGPWDFIVVGSGSAGSVLASRLSEYAGVRVLLVEAGGEAQNAGAVVKPNRALELYRSEVDWGFRSAPQQHVEPKGRTINLERGLSLGGSSSINWLLWVHGQRQDFDRWATQMGCGEEWSYERVAPHFAQLERLTRESFGDGPVASQRGSGGPIEPATLFPQPPEVTEFLEACAAEGFNVAEDYNSPSQSGAGPSQFSVHGTSGRRADAFNTFVEPVLRTRTNIRVASEVFVRRIVFDNNLRAEAVEAELNDGRLLTLHATREIVLAAGAIGSPHVLLHSGVGDRRELEALGIAPVAHVPAVGRNLQDHPAIVIPALLKEPWDSFPHSSSGVNAIAFAQSPADRTIAQEEGHERGPDCEFFMFARFSPLAGVRLVAEVFSSMLLSLGISAWRHPMLWRLLFSTGRKLAHTSFGQGITSRTLLLSGEMNHPESRGTLRLCSRDPHVPPVIDPNYCADPRDVEKLKWLLSKLRDLLRHPALFRRLQSVGFPLPAQSAPPGVLLDDGVTEEQLEYHVRYSVTTTWHYSCTVRMGPPGDETCACDPRLRVKGVHGLRCADASIMPFVNSANTNAVSMVIGRMAAGFIAEEHGLVAAASAVAADAAPPHASRL